MTGCVPSDKSLLSDMQCTMMTRRNELKIVLLVSDKERRDRKAKEQDGTEWERK